METEKVESSFAEVEDYLAIGLRPMEYRPAVIRRAMHRSALPLASLHLDHPDPVLEQKLTSVVATGYRLLDPRRREDSIQRMMLGRIHPQFAEEVIRIAQARGNQRMPFDSPDEDDFAPTEGRGLSAVPKRARGSRLSLSHRHYLADDGTNPWSASLRSHDLLVERPFKRALRSTRRWVSRRYVAAGATVGLLLISFGSWRLFRDSGKSDVASLPPEQVALMTEWIQSRPMQPLNRRVPTVQPTESLTASTLSIEASAGAQSATDAERVSPEAAGHSPSVGIIAGAVAPASFVPAAGLVEEGDSIDRLPALSEVAIEPGPVAEELGGSANATGSAMDEPGFLGRLMVGYRDLGVLLSYQPGEWLSRQSFVELADRLGIDLTNAMVEWVGV
ncbi:MAG: hypothetical protein ACO1RT_05105, partial [Planctomycetaceae bacterium]